MKKLIIGLAALILTPFANAGFIDIIDEIEKVGGLGESAWTSLSLMDDEGLTATFTSSHFVYADWGNAGFGVCGTTFGPNNVKRSGMSSNICDPSSDDGLSMGETLSISYDADVFMNLEFNNNHDGGLDGNSKVLINGVLTDISTGFAGAFFLAEGNFLTIGHVNDLVYLENVQTELEDTPVPEPASLALFSAGLIGLGLARRRSKI